MYDQNTSHVWANLLKMLPLLLYTLLLQTGQLAGMRAAY